MRPIPFEAISLGAILSEFVELLGIPKDTVLNAAFGVVLGFVVIDKLTAGVYGCRTGLVRTSGNRTNFPNLQQT